MRPLEIALFLALLLGILALAQPIRRRLPSTVLLEWLASLLPGVALPLAIAQLVVEGYRWQMVSADVLALVVFVVALGRLFQRTGDRVLRGPGVVAAAILVLVLIVVALPPILFPVPVLPALTGPYKVGTVSFDWVDTSRTESYGEVNLQGRRELMVQVWYPAAPASTAKLAPWMDHLDIVGPAIANYIHLPSFMLSHLSLTRTNAYMDVPVAPDEARYPVVVYSHGLNGFRSIIANQMEALASHGFVAVAMDHTYGAMVTVFPDGRVALNNPRALPNDVPPEVYQHASETLEATFAGDIRFVMDRLEQLNDGKYDARFKGKLDVDRIGVYGHSTGGGATILACSLDSRCKAGLGQDAWVVPIPARVVPGPLRQPFLFMRSEVWATGANDARLNELYTGMYSDAYRMTIRGTQHYDFTLLPLLTPLAPYLKLKGPLDGARALRIETDYLLAFFGRYLRGEPSALLGGASRAYPEVIFEKRR